MEYNFLFVKLELRMKINNMRNALRSTIDTVVLT